MRKRNFISIGRKITKNSCPKSMQLKSNKMSPKNVNFPRSETNQQTDMQKINIFLLIYTVFFLFKTFIAILKKLNNGFGDEGGNWPGHPLGGAHRQPQGIELSILLEPL